uniref:Uncharacterized protein n=1 Tax=Brassica campestris TaxID=3711 RepID=A0A3P5Y7E3_BRACM|nr:unnamed protein product [Brassica rapa]
MLRQHRFCPYWRSISDSSGPFTCPFTGLHQSLCLFRLSSARESNLFEVITGRTLRISLRHRSSILLV